MARERDSSGYSSDPSFGRRDAGDLYVAGIDIGGTNTELGIVSGSGSIIAREAFKTDTGPRFGDFVARLNTGLEKAMKTSGVSISGIGIGAPNANFHTGTIDNAANLPWKGMLDLKGDMEKGRSWRVRVTNDANAAAAGELLFGAARGMSGFIMLTLGTGVGSGIVIDGRVLHGHSGLAGEMGHIIMVPGGRPCGCGRKGCLETYCSARGLVTTARELLTAEGSHGGMAGETGEELNSRMLAVLAEKGNPLAVQAFSRTAEMLALAIANTVLITSPEAVILSGGLARAGDVLLKPLQEHTDRIILPAFRNTFRLMTTMLPESDAAILGAAAFAFNDLYHTV